MILRTLDLLNGPTWKTLGYIVLAFLLGFAAGNGHTTGEALKGQAAYFQQDEHQKIVQHAKVERMIQKKADIHEELTKGTIDADNK